MADQQFEASEQEFPVAEVAPAPGGTIRIITESRLWWLTLVCLVVAIGLVWASLPQRGPSIVIAFPEGHGLAQGDAVKYRGIEVGQVSDIRLSDAFDGIEVSVQLTQSAEQLARAGTQFWIERPQLSLSGVRGLETAVGAKYISAIPNLDSAAPSAHSFEGLAAPPAAQTPTRGSDFILKAQRTFGVSVGAPVTYRGHTVGQIGAIDLASDAKEIEIRVVIDSPYERLVCEGSKFWVSSGVDVDFGLKGFHFETDSLASIARGGVSFITVATSDEQPPQSASPGDSFPLHEKRDDDWLDDAASIELN